MTSLLCHSKKVYYLSLSIFFALCPSISFNQQQRSRASHLLNLELFGILFPLGIAARHCRYIRSLSVRSCSWIITFSVNLLLVQAIHPQTRTDDKQQALYNLFAAYIHTVPLQELLESVERARLEAKLRYVVVYGAVCSYCLARAERLDGSYLRTREQPLACAKKPTPISRSTAKLSAQRGEDQTREDVVRALLEKANE